VDNIYFVGNAGGAIDPFLGFGQLNSIEMESWPPGPLQTEMIMKGFLNV